MRFKSYCKSNNCLITNFKSILRLISFLINNGEVRKCLFYKVKLLKKSRID